MGLWRVGVLLLSMGCSESTLQLLRDHNHPGDTGRAAQPPGRTDFPNVHVDTGEPPVELRGDMVWISQHHDPEGNASTARELLNQHDVRVTQLDSAAVEQLLGLLAETGIVMMSASIGISDELAAALDAWVLDGGRLLLVGYHAGHCGVFGQMETIDVTCSTTSGWTGVVQAEAGAHTLLDGVDELCGRNGESWLAGEGAQAHVLAADNGWMVLGTQQAGQGMIVYQSDDWILYNSGDCSIQTQDNEMYVHNLWSYLVGGRW